MAPSAGRHGARQALKLSPQEQVPVALGFRILKLDRSRDDSWSMTEPAT